MEDVPEIMKSIRSLFLDFDEKNFSFPKNFPMDLYLNANERTKKHAKKWAVILSILGGYSGTNNLLDLLELWNKKHPEYKTSLKSFYRNKARLKNGGWEAFFGLPPRKRPPENTSPENKTEPPLSQEELKQVRALLSKMNPPTQATA
jgi:hypothetical protein